MWYSLYLKFPNPIIPILPTSCHDVAETPCIFVLSSVGHNPLHNLIVKKGPGFLSWKITLCVFTRIFKGPSRWKTGDLPWLQVPMGFHSEIRKGKPEFYYIRKLTTAFRGIVNPKQNRCSIIFVVDFYN